MSDKKLNLQVITPNGIKLDRKVDMVIMRATTGDIGVLPGHETLSALLDTGSLRTMIDGQEYRIAVFGGIAEVRKDKLTVITSLAELPEEIDAKRAERDMQEAEKRLQGNAAENETTDIYSGQVRIRRSMVRIEVSSYPIISPIQFDDDND